MAKRKTHKEDRKGWPLFNRILADYIELTRFPELPESPKQGKNYEYRPEGALCANGNPYHGCIRLGSANKLMIGFSGGGVSVDEHTAARPQRVGGQGEMFYSDDVRFGDIIPRIGTFGQSKKNPFREWNLLFVAVLHHHGYTNFQLLLKKIKELVPNPDQILVTGFSAGAFATSLLTDAVAAEFPKCRDITACVDSAMMHYDWQRVAREVWKAPEEITARLTGNEIVSDSLLALHRNHPEIRIMYCCSVRDAALTQMEMYLDDGRWIPDKAAGVSFQRKLKEMLELLQNEIPDLSTFLFDTPDKNSKDANLTVHCLCGSNAAFTTVVNGVSCADWMMRGVSGEVLKLGLGLL